MLYCHSVLPALPSFSSCTVTQCYPLSPHSPPVLCCVCTFSSMEYDPRFYGLYLHDDSLLPSNVAMWDHLDEVSPSYQDSLVMHMVHKPIQVSFDQDPDRSVLVPTLTMSPLHLSPPSQCYPSTHPHPHNVTPSLTHSLSHAAASH